MTQGEIRQLIDYLKRGYQPFLDSLGGKATSNIDSFANFYTPPFSNPVLVISSFGSNNLSFYLGGLLPSKSYVPVTTAVFLNIYDPKYLLLISLSQMFTSSSSQSLDDALQNYIDRNCVVQELDYLS